MLDEEQKGSIEGLLAHPCRSTRDQNRQPMQQKYKEIRQTGRLSCKESATAPGMLSGQPKLNQYSVSSASTLVRPQLLYCFSPFGIQKIVTYLICVL